MTVVINDYVYLKKNLYNIKSVEACASTLFILCEKYFLEQFVGILACIDKRLNLINSSLTVVGVCYTEPF